MSLCHTCNLGNHDTSLDSKYYSDRGHSRFHSFGKSTRSPEEISMDSVNMVRTSSSMYLQDETTVLNVVDGTQKAGEEVVESGEMLSFHPPVNVFGSPWSSEFCDWVSYHLCNFAPMT